MKYIIFILLFLSYFLYSYEECGIASWYGPDFHGKKTANGEIFNTNDFTAAHRTLPFGSIVKVISLENNKEVIVRINDRGPFSKNRIIDLSYASALKLDLVKKGTMNVKISLLESGKNKYHKYSNKRYSIQLASFTNENLANDFYNNFKQKGFNVKIEISNNKEKKIYRVILDNLNYSEVQLYRVKLHNIGYGNYLIKNIK